MSLLTTYRPNFCCECGDKIVRLRWRVWTSRKFCDNCSRVGKNYRLQRASFIAVLLLVGVLIGRGFRREHPPLVIERPVQTAAQPGTTGPQLPAITEQVYTCGARTRKGKPCSRRVNGPTRCWQHKGAPAMVPAEKLIIKN